VNGCRLGFGGVDLERELRHGDTVQLGEARFTVFLEAQLPCSGCGRRLPGQRAWRHLDDPALCEECATTPSRRSAPDPSTTTCALCGTPLASVPPAATDDYLCPRCRAGADVDPLSAVPRLLAALGRTEDHEVDSIPGFTAGRVLGLGAMGVVYEARRLADGRRVALKLMLSRQRVDDYLRRAFRREIELTRGLKHPNLVEVLEDGSLGGLFYLAMELCPGGTLRDRVRARGRLPAGEATALAAAVLEGLAFAHAQGVVHRDVKPGNVLLTARGDAKLGDFGLAKSYLRAGLSRMTVTGTVGGTLEFMAREQLLDFKHVRPAADVWSAAAVLYWALTGRGPRNFHDGVDPLAVVLEQPVVPVRDRDPTLPRMLAAVLDRALATDPAHRYADAAEFRAALQSAAY
jgi:serine/threonine protein kinase